MFKRARTFEVDEQPVNAAQKAAGEVLRNHLLDKWATQGMTGCEVATLCHYISEAGAFGVSDLALKPEQASKHGHEHIRLHAGKIYPDPDLHYVDTPMFVKRDARRSVEKVPILLPSTAMREFLPPEVTKATELTGDATLRGLECYSCHPTVQSASRGSPSTVVRPLALYWDGVQYSINDSFMGFYVTDVLSEQKFLSFILRRALCCFCKQDI